MKKCVPEEVYVRKLFEIKNESGNSKCGKQIADLRENGLFIPLMDNNEHNNATKFKVLPGTTYCCST